MGPAGERERNGARTREAILDAAERLFAERGFEATSLSDVGAMAGVSRGTPGYFFGSKEELYRAVIQRCFQEVREAVQAGRVRALASQEPAEVVLAGAVGEYFDFLQARPQFIRLLEWEALTGGQLLQDLPLLSGALQDALAAIMAELGLPADESAEARHLLVSIIALCWFPVVHGSTVLPALGVDARDAAFVAQRRRHVIDLVCNGLRGRLTAAEPVTSRPHPEGSH